MGCLSRAVNLPEIAGIFIQSTDDVCGQHSKGECTMEQRDALEQRLSELADLARTKGSTTDHQKRITFDGGNTSGEGWVHIEYSFNERHELIFKSWDSNGFDNDPYEDERPAKIDEIIERLRNGEVPLWRWSSPAMLEWLSKCINVKTEALREIVRRQIGQMSATELLTIAYIAGLEIPVKRSANPTQSPR